MIMSTFKKILLVVLVVLSCKVEPKKTPKETPKQTPKQTPSVQNPACVKQKEGTPKANALLKLKEGKAWLLKRREASGSSEGINVVGSFVEAQRILTQAIGLAPNDAEAYYIRHIVHLYLFDAGKNPSDKVKAVADKKKAIELNAKLATIRDSEVLTCRTPKETPKATPTETPEETTEETPKATPTETPEETPEETTEETPTETTEETTEDKTPTETTTETTEDKTTPKTTPKATPKATPKVTPKAKTSQDYIREAKAKINEVISSMNNKKMRLLYQEAIDLATQAIDLSDNEHTRRLRAKAYDLKARAYGGYAPEAYADAEKAYDDATKAIAFNNKNYRNYDARVYAIEAWEENYSKQLETGKANEDGYAKIMSTFDDDTNRSLSLQPAE